MILVLLHRPMLLNEVRVIQKLWGYRLSQVKDMRMLLLHLVINLLLRNVFMRATCVRTADFIVGCCCTRSNRMLFWIHFVTTMAHIRWGSNLGPVQKRLRAVNNVLGLCFLYWWLHLLIKKSVLLLVGSHWADIPKNWLKCYLLLLATYLLLLGNYDLFELVLLLLLRHHVVVVVFHHYGIFEEALLDGCPLVSTGVKQQLLLLLWKYSLILRMRLLRLMLIGHCI